MDWGGTSVGKQSNKGLKRGQLPVNRLVVSALVWPCPAPGHHRFFCLIKLLFLTIFPGEGLSVLCARVYMEV